MLVLSDLSGFVIIFPCNFKAIVNPLNLVKLCFHQKICLAFLYSPHFFQKVWKLGDEGSGKNKNNFSVGLKKCRLLPVIIWVKPSNAFYFKTLAFKNFKKCELRFNRRQLSKIFKILQIYETNDSQNRNLNF